TESPPSMFRQVHLSRRSHSKGASSMEFRKTFTWAIVLAGSLVLACGESRNGLTPGGGSPGSSSRDQDGSVGGSSSGASGTGSGTSTGSGACKGASGDGGSTDAGGEAGTSRSGGPRRKPNVKRPW